MNTHLYSLDGHHGSPPRADGTLQTRLEPGRALARPDHSSQNRGRRNKYRQLSRSNRLGRFRSRVFLHGLGSTSRNNNRKTTRRDPISDPGLQPWSHSSFSSCQSHGQQIPSEARTKFRSEHPRFTQVKSNRRGPLVPRLTTHIAPRLIPIFERSGLAYLGRDRVGRCERTEISFS